MENDLKIKAMVLEKYSAVAASEEGACCGSACCGDHKIELVMAEDYTVLDGYVKAADLGLGCGLPTEYAQLKSGDVVVDLGSGAGNDAFIARAVVGESGSVIGVDMTPAMIARARENAAKLGYNNVTFRLGELENVPISDNSVDVVVSNCVFNLVPNKTQAFAETFRILKSKAHFSISDIVIEGNMPEGLKKDAEMYAGCVAGAIQKTDYLNLIAATGFEAITIQKYRPITLPDNILEKYLSAEEIIEVKNGTFGIFSLSVYGEKP